MVSDEELNKKRSVFLDLTNEGVNVKKQLAGLLFYVSVFVVIIPLILVRRNNVKFLEAYMPNLDLIATVLGYGQGPFGQGLFKYLYNPGVVSLYGFWSSQFINYMSLLGVTYVIAYYTYKTNSILKGWSRSFFMLIITYLLPGNILAELMFQVGNKLNNVIPREKLLHNYIMYGLGFTVVYLIIVLEEHLIEMFADPLVGLLKKLKRQKKQVL